MAFTGFDFGTGFIWGAKGSTRDKVLATSVPCLIALATYVACAFVGSEVHGFVVELVGGTAVIGTAIIAGHWVRHRNMQRVLAEAVNDQTGSANPPPIDAARP